jgi:hypothetical protein
MHPASALDLHLLAHLFNRTTSCSADRENNANTRPAPQSEQEALGCNKIVLTMCVVISKSGLRIGVYGPRQGMVNRVARQVVALRTLLFGQIIFGRQHVTIVVESYFRWKCLVFLATALSNIKPGNRGDLCAEKEEQRLPGWPFSTQTMVAVMQHRLHHCKQSTMAVLSLGCT